MTIQEFINKLKSIDKELLTHEIIFVNERQEQFCVDSFIVILEKEIIDEVECIQPIIEIHD